MGGKVKLAIVFWILGAVLSGTAPAVGSIAPALLGGTITLVAWVLMPVAIYKDRVEMRQETEWSPSTLYVLVAVVPGIFSIATGALYLYQRGKAVRKEEKARKLEEFHAGKDST